MIPKVIHYCWFGGKPLDELSERCIASWKKFCPDYKLVRWDETNYDVTKNEYMRRAYEEKKWAFVSDYARLDIIYEHGGVYLDTDVELIKPLDELLNRRAFMGIEYSLYVNTGLGIGGEPGVKLFQILCEDYNTANFFRDDGSLNMVPCSYYQTEHLEALGYVREDRCQEVEGVTLLPSWVLASRDWYFGTLEGVREETVAIHHGAASWLDEEQRALRQRQHRLVDRYGKRLGGLLANGLRVLVYMKKYGVKATAQKLKDTM